MIYFDPERAVQAARASHQALAAEAMKAPGAEPALIKMQDRAYAVNEAFIRWFTTESNSGPNGKDLALSAGQLAATILANTLRILVENGYPELAEYAGDVFERTLARAVGGGIAPDGLRSATVSIKGEEGGRA